MHIDKLVNLELEKKAEVDRLHYESFPKGRNELKPECTYIFYNENSNLLGYCEIANPPIENFCRFALRKPDYMITREELELADGLYLKYLTVAPQFRKQGFGKNIMYTSINQARIDESNQGKLLTSSVTLITEELEAQNYFIKQGFIRIKEVMDENYKTDERIISAVLQRNV